MLLGEHLKWTKQVTQVKITLNWAIDILSKLPNITNRNIFKMIYHSLFSSQLHYGAELWGQTNTENKKQIEILHKREV